MSLTPRPRDGLGQALVCIVAAVALIAAGCGNDQPAPPASAVTPDPDTSTVEGVTAETGTEPVEPDPKDGSEPAAEPEEPDPKDGSEPAAEPEEPDPEDGSEPAAEPEEPDPEDGSEPAAEPEEPDPEDGSEPAAEPEEPEPEPAEEPEPEDGSEPAAEPEDGSETATEPAGCVVDGERVEPYAGCVPEVHPDTPELSWVLDPSRTTRPPTPEGLPDFSPVGAGTGDLPRPTPELVAWSDDVCLGSGTPATVCAQVLNQSVWALDYLGASQACVIAEMTAQVELRHALGGSSMINNLERGWFLCPSVIMPDADTLNPDPECDVVGGGVCFTAEEMAQRCRDVLPADADLYFSDCDEWGVWMVQGSRATLDSAAESLAAEWLQHHYGAPFGWSPG